jgi:hypothetical protein
MGGLLRRITLTALFLQNPFLPIAILMGLLLLSPRMVDVGRFSIEMIWKWESFVIIYSAGPLFGRGTIENDLYISDNCHQNEDSFSALGGGRGAYGEGAGLNEHALFGQRQFRVLDYEVFKIVID